MSKIFIIGLPRTGTTSLCAAMLDMGYKVAHTAYTMAAIEQADVIADTPAFVDYPFFEQRYPGAKFIYLQRDIEQWLPSIKQLLLRMKKNINNDAGGFNPVLKRCFKSVFSPFEQPHISNDDHLSRCYFAHQQQVQRYFQQQPHKLLTIHISDIDAPAKLQQFLGHQAQAVPFPHLNQGQSIIGWNKIDHPNKVLANLPGAKGRKYFALSSA